MKKDFVSSDYKIREWDFNKLCKKSDSVIKKGKAYIVKENVTISKNHVLEIKEDVKSIKFYKDCAIIIEGELKTSIKKNKKVIFSSLRSSSIKRGIEWPNVWKGLVIKGKATINNCLLKNSVVGIYVLGGEAELSDNEIVSHLYGIRCDKAKVIIKNNIFKHCSDGVFLYHTKNVKISNNKFLNNGCGVYCFFSDGIIRDNYIEVFEKEFMKGGYSGIYAYGSKFMVRNNEIKTTPVALVCGMNSNLKIKNNYLETPRSIHIFNPYIQFDIHLKSDIKVFSSNKGRIKLENKELELPSFVGKLEEIGVLNNFNFYKRLLEEIPKSKLKMIIKEVRNAIKNNKYKNCHKKNLYKRITTEIYDRFKKLKQICFLYSVTKEKKYIYMIKEIIEKSEEYIDNNMWQAQPGLDIPFSYYLNAYCLCYNIIKNDKELKKELMEETKKMKERVDELSKYNEWWITQIEGLNTHQKLLASSSLVLFALEFNKKEKLIFWKKIFEKCLFETIEKDNYYLRTETPIFLFELYFYLREKELNNNQIDFFIKKIFKKDRIGYYIKKSLIN